MRARGCLGTLLLTVAQSCRFTALDIFTLLALSQNESSHHIDACLPSLVEMSSGEVTGAPDVCACGGWGVAHGGGGAQSIRRDEISILHAF